MVPESDRPPAPSSAPTVPAPASRDARIESAIPDCLKLRLRAVDIASTPAGARARKGALFSEAP
jgi:hypothetical protein